MVYRQQFETDYVFAGGRDGRAVKQLLGTEVGRTKGAHALLTMATEAWQYPGGFETKQAVTIHGFWEQFNAIQRMLGWYRRGLKPGEPSWKQRERLQEELSKLRETVRFAEKDAPERKRLTEVKQLIGVLDEFDGKAAAQPANA